MTPGAIAYQHDGSGGYEGKNNGDNISCAGQGGKDPYGWLSGLKVRSSPTIYKTMPIHMISARKVLL